MDYKHYILLGLSVLMFAGVLIYMRFFTTSQEGGFIVSGDRLAGIVDEIRGSTKAKWIKKLEEMETREAVARQKRDELYKELRESGMGQDYHDELKILMSRKHAPLEDVNPRDPNADLVDVFEAIKNKEKQLTNHYLDVIAVRTALDHEIPAEDAVSYAKVVQPDRIALDHQAIKAPIRSTTDGKLDAFKSNVNKGGSEIDAMIKYADMVLENMGAELERETDGGIEIVLDSNEFGSSQGDPLSPNYLNMDDQGTSDGGFDLRGGRIISKDALANQSLFIDKWYVMGPFENRFRESIDASFLPENVIDLDHTTVGKGGQTIKWEYWRFKNVRIEPVRGTAPQGAVYYGWTEIWVDEPGFYFVSMGSDDYGKLWVNGELVWKSGTEPKSFRADEHTMEIELKQGVNELLFRCENGGGTMGWALIFHTLAEE